MVLDASFVVAIVQRNTSAMRFKSVLSRGVVLAPTLGEIVYKLRQVANIAPKQVALFLQSQGARAAPLEAGAALRFAAFKELDAQSTAAQQAAAAPTVKSLSFADICCLAGAAELGLPVLTGDVHWTTLGPFGLTVPVFDFRDSTVTI